MRIGVTGCTGFIGREVVRRALAGGHEVVGYSRRRDVTVPGVVAMRDFDIGRGIDVGELDGMVHLAGESVLGRWTRRKRARILESRRDGTRAVVEAMGRVANGPRVLVSASAIGIYGNRGDEVLTERSSEGVGFLADVVRSWEAEAACAEDAGVRVAKMRIGFVLGRGGAGAAMLRWLFSNGLGGRIGTGKQWMSWVHVADVAGLMVSALEDEGVSGVTNVVAPGVVRNVEFTKVVASKMGKPAVLPVPAMALRLALGDASSLMLGSQRVAPEAALGRGYRYQFGELGGAVEEALVSQVEKMG
ncbi:MAG: TIGR01777 family oxidoreductase [Verrucomicrobiota bacterium]